LRGLGCCLLTSGLLAGPALVNVAAAATFTLVNLDLAGSGLNDPTVTAPVGGNTGTTVGEQATLVFEYAASLWGVVLDSPVDVRVGASFAPLSCSETSGILGSAGPTTAHKNFAGAPRADTFYVQATANALSGSDLSPGTNDLTMQFNGQLGQPGCLSSKAWYYGFDGAAGPTEIDLVSVAAHEIGHGLGFLSLVTLYTGSTFSLEDDAYMVNLEDHDTGLVYPDMTDAERVTASTNTGDLHWIGGAVVAWSGALSAGVHASGHVEMYAPNPRKPGSSVSHFSNSVFPEAMMEPSYTGPNHDVFLSSRLLADVGWPLVGCGDGVVGFGESCDDGNNLNGDCCLSSCILDPVAAACEDGDLCTFGDTCDGAGLCSSGAALGCEDGNLCTDDSCVSNTGCVNSPNTAACDDGIACSTPDNCSASQCVGNWSCDLDYFKVYKASKVKGTVFTQSSIVVNDLLETKIMILKRPDGFGSPVAVDGSTVEVAGVGLACYKARDASGQSGFAGRRMLTTDVFGNLSLEFKKAASLCVPGSQDLLMPPAQPPAHEIDEYKCYKARVTPGTLKFAGAEFSAVDGLETRELVLKRPTLACTAATGVDGLTVFHADRNLVCYKTKDAKTTPKQAKFVSSDILVNNALGQGQLTLKKPSLLCLPATAVDLGTL